MPFLDDESEESSKDLQSCIIDHLHSSRSIANTRRFKEDALKDIIRSFDIDVDNVVEYLNQFELCLNTLPDFEGYENDQLLGYICVDADVELSHVLAREGNPFDENFQQELLIQDIRSEWSMMKEHLVNHSIDEGTKQVFDMLFSNVNNFIRNLDLNRRKTVFVHAINTLRSKILQLCTYVLQKDISRTDEYGACIVKTCTTMLESILPFLQQHHPDFA